MLASKKANSGPPRAELISQIYNQPLAKALSVDLDSQPSGVDRQRPVKESGAFAEYPGGTVINGVEFKNIPPPATDESKPQGSHQTHTQPGQAKPSVLKTPSGLGGGHNLVDHTRSVPSKPKIDPEANETQEASLWKGSFAASKNEHKQAGHTKLPTQPKIDPEANETQEASLWKGSFAASKNEHKQAGHTKLPTQSKMNDEATNGIQKFIPRNEFTAPENKKPTFELQGQNNQKLKTQENKSNENSFCTK